MDKNILITIFTPTFNRAHLLPRLYESLRRQINTCFEWLVVDDGSTDDTRSMVQRWIEEDQVSIRYIYQENVGKMRAHNRGVEECKTELFMCLDSDDYLSDDCVDRIYSHWEKYKNNKKVSGMVAYRKMIGEPMSVFPNVEFSTMHELNKVYVGETALAFRTDILRMYPFPVVDGEKFIGEGYVYDKLDQKYVLAVIPEYWMVCEYQSGGYTDSALKTLIKNPKGWALNSKQKYLFYGDTVTKKIKYMSAYVCSSLFANYKLSHIIKHAPNFYLCIFCLPLGWLQMKINVKKMS